MAGAANLKPVFISRTITATDGLKLHARDYSPRVPHGLAVVCLPGLARTSADFHPLAEALSGGGTHPRRVLALDYRGRGLSEYDPNPANYALHIELSDVLKVLATLDVTRAVFIGTSRGGILTMLLASVAPAMIAGAVLNDIGPVIEPAGLMRIKGYVGKLPQPESFDDGAAILRRLFGAQFPNLTAEDWLANARNTFKLENGRLVPTYDVKLSTTLDAFDPEQPLPALWKEFDALAGVPVMVVRGANSDILSLATMDAMRARHAALEIVEIPDQGHAPLLAEDDTIRRIAAFIERCDPALSR